METKYEKDNKNNYFDDESESEEEREFTFEERLRVEHLDKKREGLQIKHLKISKMNYITVKKYWKKSFKKITDRIV